MTKLRLLIFVFMVAWCGVCFSEIEIKILDAPHEVLRYSPVTVIFSLQNNSPHELLLCINEESVPGCGWYFQISDKNRVLPLAPTEATQASDGVIRLHAGQKRLFHATLTDRLRESGMYELRTILHGTGQCKITDPQRVTGATLRPLPSDSWNPLYECWKGQTQSEILKIKISDPVAPEDQQALDYINETRGHTVNMISFQVVYPYLKTHFSHSTYTLIAAYYAGALQEAISAFPDHPLTTYLREKLIEEQIYEGQQPSQEILKELPEPIQSFLTQYQNEMNRERQVQR